jgi:hypothetical protein
VVGFLINDVYTNTLDGLGENEEVKPLDEGDRSASETQSESADSWAKTAKRIFIHNDRSWTFHFLTLARRMTIASAALYCKFYFASGHGKFLTLPLDSEVHRRHTITTRLFEKMADYSQAVGKKLIVLSIPQQAQVLCFERSKNLPNIDISFYDGFFSDFATRHGFTWIAALDTFNSATYTKDQLFYRLDGHLTLDGNQLLADVFLKRIVPLINSMKH